MTKLDRLNTFMTERLMAAVKEILFTVGRTVREYEEETERIRSENERLKQMLRDSGCIRERANPAPLQSYQPVSPVQPGWICSQNEEPEPFEEIHQDRCQRHSEQHPLIKPEKPEYSADAYRESVDLPTEASNNEGSHMCTDHTEQSTHPVEDETTNCHFPTKIKVEFMNSNLCSGDEMGSTEDVYQSWSPRSPDLPLGTSDPYRAQHPNQPTYPSGEAPPTVSQHSSSSYDANHVSYHNILCTNGAYCSSKCCEMQKRTIAKSSPVWKYFSLKEGDCSKAVCIMCRAVISRGRKEYTTSALLKHLRMKHGNVLIFGSAEKRRMKEITRKTM
ncbi:uncharacterized protein si:dkey-93n13.2 [Pimephales promelas]|uniref:uncharacterized protein si:dkey-93n13.2 n=1 Tax=Pimephales promelas TaxID=90988 RepID=UPI0019556D8D|nr:uncharacterized protein si:dkey-93n13.2 [Pimephales promelas]KAG1967580.1 zinc finger and BTB domain-containing protein 17-like [Pimephales promelas]